MSLVMLTDTSWQSALVSHDNYEDGATRTASSSLSSVWKHEQQLTTMTMKGTGELRTPVKLLRNDDVHEDVEVLTTKRHEHT